MMSPEQKEILQPRKTWKEHLDDKDFKGTFHDWLRLKKGDKKEEEYATSKQ